VERVGDLSQCLGRKPPAVHFLREPERGHHGGASVGVGRLHPLHLLPEPGSIFGSSHRSTSPITVSSEPTIAIMSAISDSRRQAAVASSATSDGARKRTRHGFGPPSETT